MDNPFAHKRRQSSSSSEYNPFDVAENYYGPRTNPAAAPLNSRLGRVRTLSLVETNALRGRYFDSSESSDDGVSDVEHPHSDDEDRIQLDFRQPAPLESLRERSLETTPDPMDSTASLGSGVKSPPTLDGDLSETGMSTFTRRPSIMPIYGELSESLVGSNPEIHAAAVEKHLKKAKALKTRHFRRSSVDDTNLSTPKKFFISDIDITLKQLLQNEDTDHNFQITIEDTGPKVLKLGTVNSNGYKQADVRGTYMLSNLLQELTIAKRMGRKQMILDEARLNENPVDRLRRLITTQFWKSLTRQVDEFNIADMARDTKIQEEYYDENGVLHTSKVCHRLYIPHDRKDQYDYYTRIANSNPDLHLDVKYLPEKIDADYIKSINKKPGLLSLSSTPDPDDNTKLVNQPYVVPGGRFNELYGWDSYMETLGLLVTATEQNTERLRLCRGMAENFIYEIFYYGKILNANRSYYLGRSQPPFLTDMAIRIYEKTMEIYKGNEFVEQDARDFLLRATQAAIKEYNSIWCSEPRLDIATGLSCYHPEGKGIPPETEATHFDSVLEPYATKHKCTKAEFIELYNDGKVHEPALDEYFLHDRAVRESGHDTSYRLEGKCAHLATVDLNSLLYKYETDIAYIVENHFDNKLENFHTKELETKEKWNEKADIRKKNMTKYLWNEKEGAFYDYNVKSKEITDYESATTFWPLWSKVATEEQAAKLVQNLHKFEEFGGLVSGTLKSRGLIGLDRPSRQWDYPFGWAPQQILAWIGFSNYGYEGVTRRLAYRWLYLMTQAFVDFNGIVVEKYDVTQRIAPHKVTAEYGNQGSDFKGVATEGFGWVNASYVFGLTFMSLHGRRCLGTLTNPDVFLAHLNPDQSILYDNRKSK
ncbi:cytosolic neutral trehalase [[Candida] anglica]|uniref:Trehalase n=1 Tax=[Candida] anglica TaxID=148631 RepID=A0ABP0ED63_9ASCO